MRANPVERLGEVRELSLEPEPQRQVDVVGGIEVDVEDRIVENGGAHHHARDAEGRVTQDPLADLGIGQRVQPVVEPDQVLVAPLAAGADENHLGVRLEEPGLLLEACRLTLVVAVEEGDVLAPRRWNRKIAVAAVALIRLVAARADPLVGFRQSLEDRGGAVGASSRR